MDFEIGGLVTGRIGTVVSFINTSNVSYICVFVPQFGGVCFFKPYEVKSLRRET